MDLITQIRRLLEYSGSTVETISQTKDGAVVDTTFNGQKHRIYVAPIKEKKKPRKLQETFAFEY